MLPSYVMLIVDTATRVANSAGYVIVSVLRHKNYPRELRHVIEGDGHLLDRMHAYLVWRS